MGRNIVKAKLDVIFKRLFADEDNLDLLHDFLSSLLEIPHDSITNIVVQNPEIMPESISGKFSRMDLKLTVNDSLVNVEMQIKDEPDFRDRVLFYWAKLYSGDLKSGDEYGDLRQSISINIMNFNMFDCPEYHSVFKIEETTRHEILSDKCAIHFFELKKINRKKADKNNRMELWLQLVNAESEEELDMLQNTNVPEIKKAVRVIHRMSDDEKLRELAEMREKALHVEATALGHAKREGIDIGIGIGIKQGINQGIQQGIKQGIQETHDAFIEQMKLSGIPQETIDAIVGRLK